MEETEIMTIEEVSKYLKMNERTVYKLIQSGQIPAVKLGKQWRLNKEKINEWLGFKVAEMPNEDLKLLERDHKEAVIKIVPLLEKEDILFNFYATSKSHAIQKLVSAMTKNNKFSEDEGRKLLGAVMERERLCSTAAGEGVAIPHPRDAVITGIKKPLLVLAVNRHGLDFESLDGKPTHLIFLLCAPRCDIHLKMMARLSRILRDKLLRHKLTQAKDYDEFMQILKDKKKLMAKEEEE